MLQRIYIDNYRCFQDFELRPQGISLILGANGTGKSSIFEVLYKIQQLVGGRASAAQLFDRRHCTRWGTYTLQQFELSFTNGVSQYDYRLEIGFKEGRQAFISGEFVDVDGNRLYGFDRKEATIRLVPPHYATIPAGENISPMANVPSDFDVPPLSWVRSQIRNLWIVGPVPPRIDPIANLGDEWLLPGLANFSSWLRHLTRHRAPAVAHLQRSLREVLDGFQSFAFKRQGAGRYLLLFVFKSRSRSARPIELALDELSEGQRALVVLHALLHHAPDQGGTLCIDEPENYLALPEIQPWLSELTVQAEDQGRQVLLISHHPQLINLLAADGGIWLERPPVGPVRARPITRDKSGLDPAELIARGWLDG